MAIKIYYKPTFIRQAGKLPKDLQDEVMERIELLKDKNNHKSLKVHKLHGALSEFFSFSVNYRYRVVFEYVTKQEIVLMAIGDHDIYK